MTGEERDELAAAIRRIARQAGDVILGYYEDGVAAREKADRSPVTAADDAANDLIVGELRRLTPDIPVVAEESVARGDVPAVDGGPFWLVDPLDGTKEFLNRNGEFTVNIALVENRRPVFGVVFIPAREALYWGCDGGGAFVEAGGPPRRIHARPEPADGVVALVSRSHRDEETARYLAGFRVEEERSAGSSLKFCLIAAGEADLYPRFGRTMEWDTAAGHAVLAAAGGRVVTVDDRDLGYGKKDFANPSFVARGAHP